MERSFYPGPGTGQRLSGAAWWGRQGRALLDPAAPAAVRLMLEHDPGERLRRLRAAGGDAVRQRVAPTRPRMRALSARPGGTLRWASVAAPAPPGPLGAVVHPIAVATCDMDRPILLGSTPFVAPLCVGHECVAEVLRVGSEVRDVAPGDRVVVPFQISCGSCAPCHRGHTANCASVPPLSMYGFGLAGGHWGGAIADELAVPFADGMLVALPAGVDPVAAASVADNVSDAYRHLDPHVADLLAAHPDGRVEIVGALRPRHPFTASVSLYAGLIARALGAQRVTLVDARPAIRTAARSLGLDALEPSAARHADPAPLVVDVSASAAGLAYAIRRTARDGTCTSSGNLHAHARVPVGVMYGRNVTLHIGRTHARAVIPEVLRLMTAGALRPELVTTLLSPMDDAPDALAEHVRAGHAKTVLRAG